MISFTCNNCGDILKKKDVGQHVEKCHGPFPLTCANCLQDFERDQYVEHTTCKTKVKTSVAVASVAVKNVAVKNVALPSVPKTTKPRRAGKTYPKQVKQENWMSAIRTTLSAPDLTSLQSSLLATLAKRDATPTEKNKFQKFALAVWKSGSESEHVVEHVFSLVDLEMKKIEAQQQTKSNCTGSDAGKAGEVVVDKASKKHKEKKNKTQEKESVKVEVTGERMEEKDIDAVMEDTTNIKSMNKKHKMQEDKVERKQSKKAKR